MVVEGENECRLSPERDIKKIELFSKCDGKDEESVRNKHRDTRSLQSAVIHEIVQCFMYMSREDMNECSHVLVMVEGTVEGKREAVREGMRWFCGG